MSLPSRLVFEDFDFNELVRYALKDRVLGSYKIPNFTVTQVINEGGSWSVDLDVVEAPAPTAVTPSV